MIGNKALNWREYRSANQCKIEQGRSFSGKGADILNSQAEYSWEHDGEEKSQCSQEILVKPGIKMDDDKEKDDHSGSKKAQQLMGFDKFQHHDSKYPHCGSKNIIEGKISGSLIIGIIQNRLEVRDKKTAGGSFGTHVKKHGKKPKEQMFVRIGFLHDSPEGKAIVVFRFQGRNLRYSKQYGYGQQDCGEQKVRQVKPYFANLIID